MSETSISEDPVDVLIIGAGASGAAVAWSLADTRMRIVCLEQGDWMNPTDYATNKMDWEVHQYGKFNIDPNVRGLATLAPSTMMNLPSMLLTSLG